MSEASDKAFSNQFMRLAHFRFDAANFQDRYANDYICTMGAASLMTTEKCSLLLATRGLSCRGCLNKIRRNFNTIVDHIKLGGYLADPELEAPIIRILRNIVFGENSGAFVEKRFAYIESKKALEKEKEKPAKKEVQQKVDKRVKLKNMPILDKPCAIPKRSKLDITFSEMEKRESENFTKDILDTASTSSQILEGRVDSSILVFNPDTVKVPSVFFTGKCEKCGAKRSKIVSNDTCHICYAREKFNRKHKIKEV